MVRTGQGEFVKARRRSAVGVGARGRGVVLAGALGGVVSLAAVPAAAAPVAVAGGALRVEVAKGIEDGATLPGRIADRHPDLAREVAEAPGRERFIAVEIEGEYLDFRYRVVPMRDGEVVGEAGEWIACKCSNDDLLKGIDDGIAAAVERLRMPEDGGSSERPATEVPGPVSPGPEPQYRRMTSLGVAGIVVGAVGVSGMVVGGVLMARGEQVVAESQHFVRDHRPPGVAVLVSGGALLSAGVAMLVTDLVLCQRKHARCAVEATGGRAQRVGPSRALVLRPWLDGSRVGLAGRF